MARTMLLMFMCLVLLSSSSVSAVRISAAEAQRYSAASVRADARLPHRLIARQRARDRALRMPAGVAQWRLMS